VTVSTKNGFRLIQVSFYADLHSFVKNIIQRGMRSAGHVERTEEKRSEYVILLGEHRVKCAVWTAWRRSRVWICELVL